MKNSLPNIWLLFVLACIATTSASAEEPLNHQTRDYDQQHIIVNLDLDVEGGIVNGKASLTIQPLVDSFKKLRIHSESTRIGSVYIGEKKCKHHYRDSVLVIDLPRKYAKTEVFTVTIQYQAEPQTGLYFFHPTSENPEIPYQVWSQGQSEDNRHWFPSYDKPDDKLTSEMIVRVPKGMRAFSNGDLLAVTEHGENGGHSYHWKTGFEHSSYLITLVAGDFETVTDTVKGVALNYNIPADMAGMDPDLAFGRSAEMMTFYSEWIGPYPYSQYSQTPVQDFRYGGMENTTASTLNKRIFHDQHSVPNYSPDGLIAHEMVHQWFGDLVTCTTWDHIWLNEGLTSYFTDLFFEYEDGADEFRRQRYSQNARLIHRGSRGLEKKQLSEDGVTPIDLSGGNAYSRGAAIAHMIRYEVGDGHFQQGIHKYLADYAYKNATSEDFRHVMESVSGKDLSQFFRQWVYGAGHPEFNVAWEWDAQAKMVHLMVEQVQDTLPAVGIFVLTVPVEISAGKQVITEKVRINQRKHRFSWPLEQKPDMVRFDKGHWILKKLNFEKSAAELRYQLLYDSDVTGRYQAAEQIAKLEGPDMDLLRRAFKREKSYWVRERIVETLGEVKSAGALELLMLAARDADGRVRAEVMSQLAHFDGEAVSDLLLEHMNTDQNNFVRSSAAGSYGKLAPKGAFENLAKLMDVPSDDNLVRRGAFSGMSELKDVRALPFVKEFVQYKYSRGGSHRLETTAIRCAENLAEVDRAGAIDAIAEGLKNPFFRTRTFAASTLARLGATEKISDIKKIAKNERRNYVRPALDEAIEKLSSIGTD